MPVEKLPLWTRFWTRYRQRCVEQEVDVDFEKDYHLVGEKLEADQVKQQLVSLTHCRRECCGH